MLGGIVGIVVDAQHEGRVRAVSRGGDDDFLHRGAQVLFGVRALGEQAGRLNNNVGAHRSPVNFRGILGLENLEALPFHGDGIVGVGHLVVEIAENRIVLEKVSECGGVGDVVNGDELDIFVIQRSAHDIASDAAETVDTYLDGHSSSDGMVTRSEPAQTGNRPMCELEMLWAARKKVNAVASGRLAAGVREERRNVKC